MRHTPVQSNAQAAPRVLCIFEDPNVTSAVTISDGSKCSSNPYQKEQKTTPTHPKQLGDLRWRKTSLEIAHANTDEEARVWSIDEEWVIFFYWGEEWKCLATLRKEKQTSCWKHLHRIISYKSSLPFFCSHPINLALGNAVRGREKGSGRR